VKKGFVVPNGSIGFRWEEGTGWNLNMEDSATGANIDPLLSYSGENDGWVSADFPLFEVAGPGTRSGAVPVQKIAAGGEELVVATVFDLMTAHLGVNRGESATDYDDTFFCTPVWLEAITGSCGKTRLGSPGNLPRTPKRQRQVVDIPGGGYQPLVSQ